jgi:predicted transcriptional regulator of viral defense system
MIYYNVHMSTVKRNNASGRFRDLAMLGEDVFHVRDLANLWEIRDKNTLHTTLKRYTQMGLLYRIYRGFYSLRPVEDIDPWVLGIKAIHDYAYIGAESILFNEGIINQPPSYVTVISGQSKKYSIGSNNYYSRKMNEIYLYNPDGLLKKKGIMVSAVSRAVVDMLYFNPKYYFDNDKLINWSEVKRLQKSLGYLSPIKQNDSSQS